MVFAGFGSGVIGSVAGLASLISYPALLAAGVPPLSANMSNTVALVFGGVGSVSSSLPELSGQRARAIRLGVLASVGGVIGGVLLLATPSDAFVRIVPWCVAIAGLSILLPRPTTPPPTGHRMGWVTPVVVFIVAVYVGYFGAGGGVIFLAVLLATTAETLPRGNALRNVVLALGNAVTAVLFVIVGPISWSTAIPLAVGFFVGGRIGPHIVRRAPAQPLRLCIAVAAVAVGIRLGLSAYG